MKSLRTLFLIASLSAAPAFAAEPAKPNILVILADDQGRGDYSAFGTKDIRTPAIDRICREGITFDNFFANSCVCSPTRAALLTGCFPARVGIPGMVREEDPAMNWAFLSPRAKLLPQVLKPAGYDSEIVGKWNLGLYSPNTPTERGFDHFDGFLGDMMEDYWTHLRHGQNFMRHDRETIAPTGHATDLFTQWACSYLRARAKASSPFFLYLAYNAPHDPIQPPPEWLAKGKQREPQMDEKRAKLVALIEHMDDGIRQVLETLDSTGLAANTLVIFTSDNGGVLANGANNGPWRSGKTHMYEGGLRVPAAARWPGHIAPGRHTERFTMSMDIFATACAAAGVPAPAGIDGVSFLSTLLDHPEPAPATPRDAYFVWLEGGPMHGGLMTNAFRRGHWKIVQDDPFRPRELYNLENDPGETTDLATSEKKIFNELDAGFRKQLQRAGSVPWQRPEN